MKIRYIICFFSCTLVFLLSCGVSCRILGRRMAGQDFQKRQTAETAEGKAVGEIQALRETAESIQGEIAPQSEAAAAQAAEPGRRKAVIGYAYFITAEDGLITVYQGDTQTVYLRTNIEIDRLRSSERQRLLKGFYVDSDQELFDYLENNTS